ncbi:MAG: hypothetical protein EXX96DRAFT_488418 [Benjaminiella poitrasii]|nr:MAG: hypothetical protein EXX96DRAFT_488418 [Benjaminiella poitrasii]
MSNPIADTADYFARWKHHNSNLALQTNNMSDVRTQWFKVLNRLSSFNPLDSETEYPSDDDNSSIIDRDTFELLRSGGGSSADIRKYTVSTTSNDDTEKLPSAYELENGHITNPLSEDTVLREESQYFTHPFFFSHLSEPPQRPSPAITPLLSRTGRYHETPGNSNHEGTTDRPVKDKWDRTLDKIKFIANLQPTSNQTSPLIPGPSHTLATYYPPAFDPIFAAFAKDEYGRNLPPILLQCIYVTVTDSEYLPGSNQWVFRVELQYGDIKWVIRRGISDFMALHIKLKVKSNLYDYVPDPPAFPNQLSNLLDSAKSTIGLYTSSYRDNEESITKVALHRRTALTQYLRSLLLRAHVTVSYDICEFLELSAISMVQDMGWKGKEGYMRNRINYVSPRCCQVWKSHRWSTEWIILRDSYMAFCTDTASISPTDVLLFDNGFKVDIQEPRVYLGSYHISISNQSRKIEIKGTKREVDQWLESIEKVSKESPWVHNHRFGSFAPVRNNAKVKWFVDAENHFNAVAEAILSAKLEIYIADWWLTPELDCSINCTLDMHIYDLIKHNLFFLMTYTCSRYDTHSHSLSDFPSEGHDREVFPGQDYSNPRVKDFVNVTQFHKTLVDRHVTPRMPWHDVTLGVVGPIARDIARHFIQRWNFLKSTKSMHRRSLPFLMPKGEYVAARDESNFSGTCRVQLLRSSSRWSSDVEREHSIYNAYMECIAHAKHYVYIENQFFISTTQDDKLLRNKIAQALVERIRCAHEKGQKFRVYVVIPLVPAFEGDLASTDASSARTVMHFQYITISRGSNSIVEKLKQIGIDPDQYISWFSLRNYGKIKVASVSSSSPFSPLDTEGSRRGSSQSHNPDNNLSNDDRDQYVSELLYIHDKLMIVDDRIVLMGSANINDRSQLGNRDSEIAMLVEDTEMVPSFMNGKEYKAAKFAYTLRMQLWKEHLGLLNFEDWSLLLQQSEDESDTHENLIETLDIPPNKAKEHLKRHQSAYPSLTRSTNNALEIRSIEAQEPVKMLDRASRTLSVYDAFSKTKQHHIKDRYDAAALDPLSDHTYHNIWLKYATSNTMIYRNLFRCVPDDTIHTYEQHRKFVPDPLKVKPGHIADPNLTGEEIVSQLDQIQGHLVLFPKDYLKDENLLAGTIIDTVTPLIIFT